MTGRMTRSGEGGGLRVLSLFAGIGGFDLGLERAGMKVVAQCEIDPFCRRVLAKHWPKVPCYEDVRDLTAERLAADGVGRIDVICGGFPCQDISIAGRAVGIGGVKSSLWGDYARLVGEIGPHYVVLENSAELAGRGLGVVLRDLAALGYDAEWHCIPAAAVGAPHDRDRLWLVAYATGFGNGLPPVEVSSRGALAQHGRWWVGEPGVRRVDDGTPQRVDRLRALGNAVVPQIPEIIGRAIIAAQSQKREAA